MVKTPRTRHSQGSKEPVTIDLSPGEVSRMKAEAEKAEDAQQPAPGAGETAAETEAEPVAPKAGEAPESGKPGSEAGKPAAAGATNSAAPSGPAKPAGASSWSQPFGRQDPVAPRPAAETRRGSAGGGLLAGVAGGVIALLLAGGLYYSGVLPAPDGTVPQQPDPGPAIAALEAEV